MAISIAELTHPLYQAYATDWLEWRSTYEGGRQFINRFLQTFSKRESTPDFDARRLVTYNPAFAEAGIDEIKNSIYRHFTDIVRLGGSSSYQDAVAHNVNLMYASMNQFVGDKVLPELLVMKKVGVYVDMPQISGVTLAEVQNVRPYLYLYPAEDIRAWNQENWNYTTVLLRDQVYEYDDETGLPIGFKTRYRRMWVKDGAVWVQYYDEGGDQEDPEAGPIRLSIPQIPLHIFEISKSLLTNVSRYQIALLNLASSDMSYALKGNYPFYTEQYNPTATDPFARPPSNDAPGETPGGTQEVRVGVAAGRRYPMGTERPGFINPSADPLRVSMEKQQQLKEEIRALLQLNLSTITSKQASAESKQMDEGTLESGLSAIARELEAGERRIAEFWAMYEKSEPAQIKYPLKFSLESDTERRARAKDTAALIPAVPSISYRREVSKRVARILLGPTAAPETLDAIDREVDAEEAINVDWQGVQSDVNLGLVDLDTASRARGWPEGVVERAKQDHAERLQRIAISQAPGGGAARGVVATDPNPVQSAKDEKAASRDTTQSGDTTPRVRGEGQS